MTWFLAWLSQGKPGIPAKKMQIRLKKQNEELAWVNLVETWHQGNQA